MKITPGLRLTPKRNVHARRFDDEMVILDLEQGLYFSLDEVGAAIWEGLVDSQPLDDILRRLARQYDVSEQRLLADSENLVARLLEAGLVVVGPAAESP